VPPIPVILLLPRLNATVQREGPELSLPGLKLRVSIDNRLQTYDSRIFFGLPLSADPRTVYLKNHRPGKTRVFVNVTPQTGGFVFRPLLALTVVGGKQYTAVRGFEFGMWDAEGQQTDTGGVWDHRDVGGGVSLTQPRKRYLLHWSSMSPFHRPDRPTFRSTFRAHFRTSRVWRPAITSDPVCAGRVGGGVYMMGISQHCRNNLLY
jgi:hypothetical protein